MFQMTNEKMAIMINNGQTDGYIIICVPIV